MKVKIEYITDIGDDGLLYIVNEFVQECIDSERVYKSLSKVPMDIIRDALLFSKFLKDELEYGIDNNLLNITKVNNGSISNTRFY